MSDFNPMSISDLILCVNLLHADAKAWENTSENPEHLIILKEYANARRQLAAKMMIEINKRQPMPQFN